jgi:2-polyprenyl-3-methyl-5-hydroxy-6-metoxy-1,4-benzoquinol methylase
MALDDTTITARDLRRTAHRCWSLGQSQAALEAAWSALERAPHERATKRLLADLLMNFPSELTAARRDLYLGFLTDREVEPHAVSSAGCHLLLRDYQRNEQTDCASLETLARSLQNDRLAMALLREAPIGLAGAELLLSRVRRWLLVSGRWPAYPELVAAFATQARLNGGAWPFDETELARLKHSESDIVAAYLPARLSGQTVNTSVDPVTRAVAEQYEGWPYPSWTRITLRGPQRLPDVIRGLDAAAAALPADANVLIAGCGTGREVVAMAQSYPDTRITAIDLSEASLDHARRCCRELGITHVRFLKLDLHDAAVLGEDFHVVSCCGVLHHLPDPERGLRILADVLHPHGVMHIMVYSRIDRFGTAGGRTLIRDLLDQPMSDDLLRRVRERLLQSEHPLAQRLRCTRDFFTLAGVHDMLLHRHEDPFDLPRLKRALQAAGMRVLAFQLPPDVAARYEAWFPDDSKHRDIDALTRFEVTKGGQFVGNYEFWCQKTPTARD